MERFYRFSLNTVYTFYVKNVDLNEVRILSGNSRNFYDFIFNYCNHVDGRVKKWKMATERKTQHVDRRYLSTIPKTP